MLAVTGCELGFMAEEKVSPYPHSIVKGGETWVGDRQTGGQRREGVKDKA